MGPSPRGGAYTYDWIENLMGLDMHSADRVLPEFQHPEPGDTIGYGSNRMRVERVEPEHVLAWRSEDGNWVWTFVLEERDGSTRLISRNRFRLPTLAARLGMITMEPASLLMERKMLNGIKERAERLDLGADRPYDAAASRSPMAADSPTPTQPPPQTGTDWTVGRILLVILGSLVALIAAGLLVAGGAILWADLTQRDDDGYLTTPTGLLETESYAITSESIDLFETDTSGDWVLSENFLGRVRITGESTRTDVFIGIAETDDVEAYLDGVEHAEVRDVDFDPFEVRYRLFAGGEPPGPPGEQTFWAASASGSGKQTVTWKAESGEWTVVLMNADASDGVAADVSVGAKVSFLLWLAIGLLIAGVLVLAVGVLLIVVGARGATSGPAPAPAALPAAAGRPTVYPVALRGELDPQLGRWLWLVKWLLAIPHYIVLAFLWIAFWVLSDRRVLRDPLHGPLPARDLRLQRRRAALDVARRLLLVLGAGDRPLPALHAGRRRGLPGLAPRRLPGAPLALAAARQVAPRDPAPDPGRDLRRRLGLGLGHGPATRSGASGSPDSSASSSSSRLSSCSSPEAIPRSLFDFALGLDRWVFRVAAYVSLMRDEYPPFRLDMGPGEPTEPAEPAETPPPAP